MSLTLKEIELPWCFWGTCLRSDKSGKSKENATNFGRCLKNKNSKFKWNDKDIKQHIYVFINFYVFIFIVFVMCDRKMKQITCILVLW